MMAVDQNKRISNVKVGSASRLDDSTNSVRVTLSWGGASEDLTYKVRKDTSRVHYLFYPSWRVQVPFTTITFNLPNQGGRVQVDGLSVAAGSKKAEAIQGFHSVTMQATDFYSADTQVADGIDNSPIVEFTTGLNPSAKAAAAGSINAAFGNVTCDVKQYFDCPNHRYAVPAGYYYMLPAAHEADRVDYLREDRRERPLRPEADSGRQQDLQLRWGLDRHPHVERGRVQLRRHAQLRHFQGLTI